MLLPKDIVAGSVYTLYQFWRWPTAPGTPDVPQGKDGYYTTCSDIDIVAQRPTGSALPMIPQDSQAKAVQDFERRAAILE